MEASEAGGGGEGASPGREGGRGRVGPAGRSPDAARAGAGAAPGARAAAGGAVRPPGREGEAAGAGAAGGGVGPEDWQAPRADQRRGLRGWKWHAERDGDPGLGVLATTDSPPWRGGGPLAARYEPSNS